MLVEYRWTDDNGEHVEMVDVLTINLCNALIRSRDARKFERWVRNESLTQTELQVEANDATSLPSPYYHRPPTPEGVKDLEIPASHVSDFLSHWGWWAFFKDDQNVRAGDRVRFHLNAEMPEHLRILDAVVTFTGIMPMNERGSEWDKVATDFIGWFVVKYDGDFATPDAVRGEVLTDADLLQRADALREDIRQYHVRLGGQPYTVGNGRVIDSYIRLDRKE